MEKVMSNNNDLAKQIEKLKQRVEILEGQVKHCRSLIRTITAEISRNFGNLCICFKTFLDSHFRERK